jgi:hypothetical protein
LRLVEQFFEFGFDVTYVSLTVVASLLARDTKNSNKHYSPNRRANEAQAIVSQV